MRKRLLVVDDDCSVRESLKRVLEESGYEVVLASDGLEAGCKLDEPEIDLLILDLNMPGRDGWDVLEDVGSKRPLVPIIVVTGMIDQLASLNIPGAAALMEKPIEVPLLLAKITDLLAETDEERLRRIHNSLEAEVWCRLDYDERVEAFGLPIQVRKSGDSMANEK